VGCAPELFLLHKIDDFIVSEREAPTSSILEGATITVHWLRTIFWELDTGAAMASLRRLLNAVSHLSVTGDLQDLPQPRPAPWAASEIMKSPTIL
jgi:hypothetical protein